MLRPREAVPEHRKGLDPVLAFTVLMLALIALGLFLAGFLAVYTYSTPGLEAPLVVGLTVAFSLLLVINVLRLGIRSLRNLMAGR
jgi:tRNA A37 threonylcarbamoyltransferase TsaD